MTTERYENGSAIPKTPVFDTKAVASEEYTRHITEGGREQLPLIMLTQGCGCGEAHTEAPPVAALTEAEYRQLIQVYCLWANAKAVEMKADREVRMVRDRARVLNEHLELVVRDRLEAAGYTRTLTFELDPDGVVRETKKTQAAGDRIKSLAQILLQAFGGRRRETNEQPRA